MSELNHDHDPVDPARTRRVRRRRLAAAAGVTGLAMLAATTTLSGCGGGETGDDPAGGETGSTAGAGTDAERSGPWNEVAEARLTAAQQAAVQRGLAARDAMFQSLLGALGSAMAEGGPASAVVICRDDAPRIASEVAEAHDVRIGRTSFKLRNPDNAAPGWVEPIVLARRETPGRFVGPDGTVGVIEPIRIMQPCIACHGPADQLAPGVADAVTASYPDDRAVGFADGDLRGWFWIEVTPEPPVPADA